MSRCLHKKICHAVCIKIFFSEPKIKPLLLFNDEFLSSQDRDNSVIIKKKEINMKLSRLKDATKLTITINNFELIKNVSVERVAKTSTRFVSGSDLDGVPVKHVLFEDIPKCSYGMFFNLVEQTKGKYAGEMKPAGFIPLSKEEFLTLNK